METSPKNKNKAREMVSALPVTVTETAELMPAINEPAKKFHSFKYWAAVVKWVVEFVGVCVDSIKENPFPRKDDFTD